MNKSEKLNYYIFLSFLLCCFIFGGSARSDVYTIFIIRPISFFILLYGLARFDRTKLSTSSFLAVFALGIFALPAVQLVPLPPALWEVLPGRAVLREIDVVIGRPHWRPLSMAPAETRNALFALVAPLALLILGVQLSSASRARLVYLIIALGCASAALGVVQFIGGQGGPFYFYDVTNRGGAVGLFANRNHQALFLVTLLPMLAFTCADANYFQFRWWAAVVAGLLLVPLILVTGSRAGAILGIISIILMFSVLGRVPLQREYRNSGLRRWTPLWVGLLGSGLIVVVALFGRATAGARLFQASAEEDLRWQILPTLGRMLRVYFPVGTGLGGFERVFRMHEPDTLLAQVYMNHAHNDWLELILTGGLPAALLMCLGFSAFAVCCWRHFRPSRISDEYAMLPRLGLVTLFLIGLASLVDYPARTPAIAALVVVAALWATCPLQPVPAIRQNSGNDAVAK